VRDASSAIRERRSIRRYQPTPVPQEVVREILEEARWAPSAGNTQSTEVFVVMGEALERVRATLREQVESEAPPAPDIPLVIADRHRERMKTLFAARSAFVAAEEGRRGLTPDSAAGTPVLANAGLFGAPVLLLLAAPNESAHDYGCFDAGLLAQTIALAAHARGLGTCIMLSPLRSSDALHRVLPQTEGRSLIAAIPLGYVDDDAPINAFRSDRIAYEEFVAVIE